MTQPTAPTAAAEVPYNVTVLAERIDSFYPKFRTEIEAALRENLDTFPTEQELSEIGQGLPSGGPGALQRPAIVSRAIEVNRARIQDSVKRALDIHGKEDPKLSDTKVQRLLQWLDLSSKEEIDQYLKSIESKPE